MNVRPLYENDSDRLNERHIAEAVVQRMRAERYFKLPISYGLDYAFERNGNLDVFGECKCRKYTFGLGDGYRISLLKCISARKIHEVTGSRCLLFVEFDDGIIRWCPFESRRCIWAGRTDRGDVADMEPHMIIAWEAFQKL